MTLRAYLRIFRERWKLLWIVTLISLGLAALITSVTPKMYEATAQIFVSSNGSSDPLAQYQAQAFAQSEVATFAEIVASPDVLHQVKTDLLLNVSDAQLRSHITADAPATTTLLNVNATDRNPAQAAAIANSAARAFIKAAMAYTTPTNSTTSSVRLTITNPATAPSSPIVPNTVLNIGLGLILGLLLGGALAVTRDLLDTRIKHVDDLDRVTSAPVMGIVVEDPSTQRHPIATRAGNRNIRSENFRQLRANLQFANVDQHPRVIAVTSSVPTEGKTAVAINLASTLAEAGFTVCLVDADLRRPSVAKVLGLPAGAGFTSVLIHQIELGEVLQHAGSGLYVLTSGPTPPNPSELLASSYVRDVIRSLLDRVDYVVLDTAPLLPVADGSEVAALADGALLVARHGFTTDNNIKRAINTLAQVDAKMLGVVLNRVPVKRKSSEYGYTYYRDSDLPTHSRPSGKRGRGNVTLEE